MTNPVMNSRNAGPRGRKSASGFSLIEFIGALAILTIIGAAAVPVVIKRIDIATHNAETVSLKAMSEALIQHVVRSNNIPNQNSWVQAIGAELPLAQSDIAANPRKWNRVYLIDPAIWCAGTLVSDSWKQVPGGLTSPPTNARIIIVSTLSGELPLPSGMPSAQTFNNVWDAPAGTKPSSLNSWTGYADDLLIQRINLAPLFHRVVLLNSYVGGQGHYSINGSTPAPVPYGGSGTNAYYLDGTVLGLHNTSQFGTNLMAKEIIKSDISRVFEYGVWLDQISGGMRPGVLSGLDEIAATFFTLNAPTNPPPDWGGNPKVLLGLMNSYMNGYTTWSAMSPCFSYFPTAKGNPNAANFPGFDELRNALEAFRKGGDIVP